MMKPEPPTIICLTPVRNEAWILDRFLAAASVWADHIVLLDQGSTDATPDCAKRWPKVIYTKYDERDFDEGRRRNALIEAGRHIPAKQRLFIALDADEFLAADFLDHPEWQTLLRTDPGTTTLCRWVNLYDGLERAHICDFSHLLAFMDDGRPIDKHFIHGPRLPINPRGPHLQLNFGKVLHHQYLNWERMKAKHRWYQCVEALRFPEKSAIAIYRQYHHMDSPCKRYDAVRQSWFDGYAKCGVDITSFSIDPLPWFYKEVLEMMEKHGTRRFARFAIWDVDWVETARLLNTEQPARFADPRTRFEKKMHAWLGASQDPGVIFGFKNRLISLFARRCLGW